jgi:hypothetical protein
MNQLYTALFNEQKILKRRSNQKRTMSVTLLVLLLLAAGCRAAVTDYKEASTGVANARSLSGVTGPGNDARNLLKCDAMLTFLHMDASASSTYFFEYSGFDLSAIPSGSILDGIEIEIVATLVQTQQPYIQVGVDLQLTFDGEMRSVNSVMRALDGSGRYTLGASDRRFGFGTFSTDRMKKAQLIAFRFEAPRQQTRQVYLDCIRMRIYYTAPTTTTTTLPTTTTTATAATTTVSSTIISTTTVTTAAITSGGGVVVTTPSSTSSSGAPTSSDAASSSTPSTTAVGSTGIADTTSVVGTTVNFPRVDTITAPVAATTTTTTTTTTAALDSNGQTGPASDSGLDWWVYVIIAIVALLLLAGCIAGGIWVKRRREAWPSARSADTVYTWDDQDHGNAIV